MTEQERIQFCQKRSECQECRLYLTASRGYVPPRGNSTNPKLILIGEAPGTTEAQEGKPFVGRSGKLLEETLKTLGYDMEDVCYITNVVKCCPLSDPLSLERGVRAPTDREIKCCLPLLKEELSRLPKDAVIVPLGNTALKALGISEGITKAAGKEYQWEGFKVVPNFHPAAVLRNPKWKQTFISVFSRLLGQDSKDWKEFVKIVQPQEALDFFEKHIQANHEWVVFDIETNSLDPFKGDIIMLSFAFPDDPYGYVVPLYYKEPREDDDYEHWTDFVPPDETLKQKILYKTSELLHKTPVIGHNIKFDLKFMVTRAGLDLDKVVVKDDTLFLSHFVFNKVQAGETLQLKDIAVKVLGLDGRWDEEVKGYLKKHYRLRKDRHYGNVPTSLLSTYAGLDTIFTKEIYLWLSEKVKVFHNDEIREALNRATILFAEAELKGFKVDQEVRSYLDYRYSQEINLALEEMNQLPTVVKWKEDHNVETFDPNSMKALKEIAFDYYKLPVVQKTDKGEPSLGKKAINWYLSNLDENSEEYKFVKLLHRIKLFRKLKSTYIDGYAGELDEQSRFHPDFNIAGTITGRLSSGLHTIPSKSDIKRMFISRWRNEGGLVISADYSQLEVRVAASLSNETKLIEAYKQGVDVHRRTASMIFGKPEEEISKQERKIAKTVVFGILYGKTAHSLAEDFGITEEEAQKWMDNLFGGYQNLKRWIDEQQKFVLQNGFVVTAFNRVIPIPSAFSQNKYERLEATRKAVNYPVQSSASDLTTTSAVRLYNYFKQLGLKSIIIGTIHDAIVIDVAPGELLEVYNLIVKSAETIPMKIYDWLRCPIRIDISIGASWGGAIEWDRIQATPDELILEGAGFHKDLAMFKLLTEMNYNLDIEEIAEEEVDELAEDQFIYSPTKKVWRIKISRK